MDNDADLTITAADGRTVGARRYGADATPSLLYLHGAPGSRAEVGLYELDLLLELDVCALAVDRAGYGLTDPADDLDILARARDALAVADAVGMRRFAVQGTSAGGPYALACAALAPDRVTSVVLAAGQGRLDTPWGLDGMQPDFVEGWQEEIRNPEQARAESEESMAAFRDAPDKIEAWMDATANWPEDERAVIRSRSEAMTEDVIEATRQGGIGYWLDGQTRSQPWPFDVTTIRVPIHVFHGEGDTWNPLGPLRRSLEGAPDVHEHVYAGNHLAAYTTRDRRAALLRATLPS